MWETVDDELPHQIRLIQRRVMGGYRTAVSCVCREEVGRHTNNGRPVYETMAYLDDGENPWVIYNHHDNHNHELVPFNEEWEKGPPWTRSKEAQALRHPIDQVLAELDLQGDEEAGPDQ